MTPVGELVLLSSTSGLDIEECAQRLCDFEQPTKPLGPIRIESFHIDEAKNFLEKRIPKPLEGYQTVDVLGLPLSELSVVCDNSWRRMLDQVRERPDKSSRFAVGTFHPVLYHQVTSEFAEPYLAGHVPELVLDYKKTHGIEVKWIVSIHDDIYDVYRKLMRPGKLFDPRRRKSRSPIDDISDLRMLLDWRDRELSAARALAVSIEAKHLLFHRKGRLNSLKQILFDGKPCVYFSHPISQPRRDIAKRQDPEKCKNPDPKRGHQLIQAIQSFADQLALFAPVVEPTAIDEARLDIGKLASLTEKDVSGTIVPPLTNRWPIGGNPRLGGDPTDLNSENTSDLLPLWNGALAALQSVSTTDKSLEWLGSSVDLLSREIMRQINVRDRVLAAQADIIVAFRPFSLPDSPDPTGGVDAEIETLKEKSGPRRCKPHLVVVHPRKDELQRRGNEFDRVWDAAVEKHYHAANDDLIRLKAECRRMIVGPKSPDTAPEFEAKLKEIFSGPLLSVRPKVRESSMPKGPLKQDADARRSFIAAISSASSILTSPLAVAADASDGAVIFVDTPEFCEQLIRLLRQAITGAEKPAAET